MISPTDMGDYGEYECEASNTVGDVQRAKAFLNVQCMYSCPVNQFTYCSVGDILDKAKVIFAPPELHFPYGKPAMLDCHYRCVLFKKSYLLYNFFIQS